METTTRYLLIGGGPAAVAAAQSIREHDADGGIVLVGDEAYFPYDKPPLSKQFLLQPDFTADDASSKFDSFYPDNRIDLRRGVRATRIEPAARRVTLNNGDVVGYEKLLLATGARPNRLDVPGSDLDGIHTLRTVDDAAAIRAAIGENRRAVIVGAGYVGMEVAAACAEGGAVVTVVEPREHPWPRFANPTVGSFLRARFATRGVAFRFGEEVAGFAGESGRLVAVTTKGGARLPADFAIVGIGVTLNTDLARDAGLQVDPKEGVVVDRFLQTFDPHIWACGDIACFDDTLLGKRWHAEHHLNAKWQGQAVGATLAGTPTPYERIPYFWSDLFDLHMILRGDPQAGERLTLLGDLAAGEFIELAADASGRLRRGIAFSHDEPKLDPISDKLEALIREGVGIEEVSAVMLGL